MNETEGQTAREVRKESILAIRQNFNYLVELLLYDEMEEDEFFKKLESLFYIDESGVPWLISVKNGNWYKLTEDGPVLGEPPDFLYRPVDLPEIKEEPTGEFCADCGKPLSEGKKFCSGCGKPA
ncbi:MAG: zinc ribbon domain-containing protein [Actinomycetota bacterium]